MLKSSIGLCCLALFTSSAAGGPITPYLTSLAGARLQPLPALSWGPPSAPGAASADIAVNRTRTYQRMLGFGSALTESAAYNYAQLGRSNATQQQLLLDLLYAPHPIGNAYAMGRLHMNSADFSLATYNLDNVTGDVALASFDAQLTHDSAFVLPFALAAQARSGGALKLFFSPWSPPGWMKASGSMINSSWPTGLLPDPAVHAAWALYFVKFAQALRSRGIEPWGLTIQNEPLIQMTNPAHLYESCAFTAEDERDFLRDHLGPALAGAGLSNLTVLAFDWNKGQLAAYLSASLSDPAALPYLGGAAVHWYAWHGDLYLDQLAALSALPHWDPAAHVLLATEACYITQGVAGAGGSSAPASGSDGTGVLFGPGPPPGNGSVVARYAVGELYLLDALGDIVFGAQGWVDWNAALDYAGGPNHLNRSDISAPILVNATTGSLYVQSMYYYIGHVSRFVPPGWQRVDALSGSTGVAASNAQFNALKLHVEQNLPNPPSSKPAGVQYCVAAAFASPDGMQAALVVLNVLPRPFAVQVRDAALGAFNATLPPRSAMTFVWDAHESH